MGIELSERRSFRTDDLDEARSYISRLLRPHDLRPAAGAFAPHFSAHDVSLGQDVRVARFRYGMPLEIDVGWPEECYFLLVPIQGRCIFRLAHGDTSLAVGEAALVSPNTYLHSRIDDEGFEKIVVRINHEPLEAVLNWSAHNDSRLGQINLIDLGRPRAVALRDEIAELVRILGDKAALELLDPFAFDRFVYALQVAIDPGWPETDGSLAHRADRIVGGAEAFMRAHREDKIHVDDIATHLHVSRRSLYLAFQMVRAYRPHNYLQRVRLESARSDLCRGAIDELSVTTVAERWGFGNLGRFDSAYRHRFGELPSETRLRRRGTHS